MQDRSCRTTYAMSLWHQEGLQGLAGSLGYKPTRGAGVGRGLPNLSAFLRDLSTAYRRNPAAVTAALRAVDVGQTEEV